jgi:hypothetical protein
MKVLVGFLLLAVAAAAYAAETGALSLCDVCPLC